MEEKYKKTSSRFARNARELAAEKIGHKQGQTAKPRIKIIRSKPAAKKAKAKPAVKPNLEDLSREYGLSAEELQSINERIYRSKRMIIISGVSFFMVLLMFFWVANIRYSISKVSPGNNGIGAYEAWSQLSQDMEKGLSGLQTEMEAVEALKDRLSAETAATGTPGLVGAAFETAATGTLPANGKVLDNLMEKINNLE